MEGVAMEGVGMGISLGDERAAQSEFTGRFSANPDDAFAESALEVGPLPGGHESSNFRVNLGKVPGSVRRLLLTVHWALLCACSNVGVLNNARDNTEFATDRATQL